MKRTIMTLLAGLVALACTKGLEPAEVSVSFRVDGVVNGGMPTKGDAEVAEVLSGIAPAYAPTLTIQSKTNPKRVYTARPGDVLTLAVDSYHVTGEGGGGGQKSIFGGKIYTSPLYAIDQDVVVGEDGGEYVLNGFYTCFAVVYDCADVASLGFSDVTNSGYVGPDVWVGDEQYHVSFVVRSGGSWTASQPLKVSVVPVDDVNYEETEYRISYGPGAQVGVSNGRWYLFSPSGVDVASGDIDVNLPGWEKGE